MNSIFENEKTTERTLIESILSSFYIVDYGFIKAVNPDETINVTHAKQLKTYDGVSLPAMETKNVEVLTLSGSGFSFKFDYKKGDKVLLLGLKDYIKKVEDVNAPSETTVYMHYSRETLKAIPLCVFNKDAKATIVVKDGKIELNGNDKQFVTWTELNTALTQFVTTLSTALLGATYVNAGGTPTPLAWTAGTPPQSLDISSAKTKTIVTGG